MRSSWRPDLEESGEDVELKHRDVVVAGQVDGGLQGHGLQAQADGVELMESLAERSPRHDGPAQVRGGSAGFPPHLITVASQSAETPEKSHLSPKERLQNSAASALVILKLSPWNKPLGKMALSSASMWLKISDSLVRFRLKKKRDGKPV